VLGAKVDARGGACLDEE